jgi:ABC-type transport system involved in cytochrome bd biosynthesis fused ATPase/permease subunit
VATKMLRDEYRHIDPGDAPGATVRRRERAAGPVRAGLVGQGGRHLDQAGCRAAHALDRDPGGRDRAEQLADAAARAGLLDWIESLPLGWETRAGAHGTTLFSGQRQRLALARALLADPALLILDEPTAHLDREARHALTRDLLAATADRATLIITMTCTGSTSSTK